MNGSLDAPPIVIRHSRIKHALMFAFCAFAEYGCIRLLMSGAAKNPVGMWLAAVLFGSLALLALAFTLYPARMELDQSGVGLEMLWKKWAFAWSDFDDFEVVQQFRGYTRRVSFRLSDSCPDEQRRTLIGSIRSFGTMWEIGPDKLCHQLKVAKRKWAG